MLKKIFVLVMLGVAGAILFNSCGDDSTDPDSSEGRIKVYLSDAPFPYDIIEEANIHVTGVEIKEYNQEDGDHDGNFIVLADIDETINLLELSNGVTETLVDRELPQGTYSEIRLIVDEASMMLSDGKMFDMKVPSGNTSGLKLKIENNLVVEGGLTSELLLDVDVSKSFVMQGNMNTPAGIKGFHFKPVVRCIVMSTSGRINGMVDDTNGDPLDNTQVSVIQDTVVTSTHTNEDGEYSIIGVEEGIYSVMFEKDGYSSVTKENINVTAANATEVNATLESE